MCLKRIQLVAPEAKLKKMHFCLHKYLEDPDLNCKTPRRMQDCDCQEIRFLIKIQPLPTQ